LSEAHSSPGTTLIIGVGNVIMGDEGFGVHVVRDSVQPTLTNLKAGKASSTHGSRTPTRATQATMRMTLRR